MTPLHVLVVDDSAVVRQGVLALLGGRGEFEVTVAADPLVAQEKMARRRPDVVLLDIEMPRMDGLSFLRRLMRRSEPVPVVICSGVAERGSQAALRALDEGAVEVIGKPRLGVREFLEESRILLGDALRAAARTRPRPAAPGPPAPRPCERAAAMRASGVVVTVGASTGGTEALRLMLQGLPANAPGMVIVQHMPEQFTGPFAARLDQLCRLVVREARDGDRVMEGTALIAPGNHHVVLERSGATFVVRVTGGPLVSRHRPSVDVLFDSVARVAGPSAIGVIMTGMGADGARGLLEMRRAGAATLAQDEASCVVFGMPQEAIARGAVQDVVPLGGLAGAILDCHRGLRARLSS